jgi:molybdopterin synthase sulfur carrier subunit
MPTVWIPSLMRDLTGGKERTSVPGRTVGQVIDALDLAYPGIKDRLCRGDRLDPAVAAFVDGRVARLGLSEPVEEESEVRFLPAMAGG